jgi:hypothetical protein
MTTNLACWSLGPAHYSESSDETLNCLACSVQVRDDQYCVECGGSLCATCTVPIYKQPHCFSCSVDAKRRGR